MHIICIYNIACRYSILFQVKAIETDDPIFLKQYLRMSPDKFNVLKVKLKPFIRILERTPRDTLSVGLRLALTINNTVYLLYT